MVLKNHPKHGYKLTEIGKIPVEWEVASLIDVADYINGYGFSPNDWKDKGIPIIRIQNLNDPHSEFNYFDGEIDHRYIVENGDLLFSWSASIGVYIWNRGKAFLNQHIFKVLPKRSVEESYLYYALYLAIAQLINRTHGSTMKHFKREELKNTLIPLPPLPEQKKIAEILSTVDKAIKKVDEAIEMTQRLKKGLMQELLTKGIRHKEFKDTETRGELGRTIGRIPKEWEAMSLSEVFKLASGKSRPSEISEIKSEEMPYPIYGGNGILGYTSKFMTNEETIVIGRVGEYCGSIHKTIKSSWITDNALYATNILNHNINLDFLTYWLTFINLNKFKKESGQPLMTQTIVYSIKLPLPPISEQKKIAEILSTVDTRLELLRKKKEKLERVKKGLMNDLLTGQRRVSV